MVLVRMVPVVVHARKRTFSMTKTTPEIEGLQWGWNYGIDEPEPGLNFTLGKYWNGLGHTDTYK